MKPYLMSELGLEAPKLTFRTGDFHPILSAKAVEMHYAQHKRYCESTRRLVAEAIENGLREPSQTRLLQDVVSWAARHTDTPGPNDLFSQAAQAWNHAFMWLSMRPFDSGPLLLDDPDAWRDSDFSDLARSAGISSFGELKSDFADLATDSFGSGWAWLALNGRKLEIRLSKDANTYVQDDRETPLLVLDLWEHAYFTDFHFNRKEYVKAMVDMVLDWDNAAARAAAHLRGDRL